MKESEFQKIGRIVESQDYFENKETILGFLKDRELKSFLMEKLPERFNNLQKIEFLLEEFVKGERPFELFKILKGSINEENKSFIVAFLQKHYEKLGGTFLMKELFQEECLVTVQTILEKYPGTVDKILGLIKRVLILRGKEYKKFETTREHRREKKLISELLEKISSLYNEKKEDEKINETIALIDKYFNLVGDDGEYITYTPNNIFWIIRDFITIDFEKNFKRITRLLINQYDQEYKRFGGKVTYKGWELMGGGISQSGNKFSITDRHFVSQALQPALERYWEKDKDKVWKFMLENCMSRTKDKVSRDRPDFLNRSALGILMKEYTGGQHKQEAFRILSDFIRMRKGIPHKPELIFQALRKSRISDARTWALIEVSLDAYNRQPINVFVNQIIGDLAKEGWKEAINVLRKLLKNSEYMKRQTDLEETSIIDNIIKLLSEESTFSEGIQIFKDYLSMDAFKKDLDRFDAFLVGKGIAYAIEKKPEEGLHILSDIYVDPSLTPNQQIALTSSLRDVEDGKGDQLEKIYDNFLKPALQDLGKNTAEIEKRFNYKEARGNIVEFADNLAKAKRFDSALEIARIFVNDTDPCTPGKPDREDPKGQFNYHKQIIDGEDVNVITTVRGRVCWLLGQFVVLDGRKYIPEVVELVDQLHGDSNYYVRQQVSFPLLELARVRNTVLPDNHSKRFLSKETADEIERIAFDMLTNEENQKLMAVMKSLARVFSYIRNIDEKRALVVVNIFKNCGFDEVISDFAPLFVFFAELRKGSLKGLKWEYLGEYNDSKFKELLEDLLRDSSSEVKSHFAWHFWKLTKESVPDKTDVKNIIKYGNAFRIANKYLKILAESYDPKTFNNIYDFIRDNIDKRFEECHGLWQICLKKERPFLERLTKKRKAHEIYWWPFRDNGQILIAIEKRGFIKEFLDSFEFLLDYPKEANIGDVNKVVEALGSLPDKYNRRVDKILGALIERNPNFYDAREKWKCRRKY